MNRCVPNPAINKYHITERTTRPFTKLIGIKHDFVGIDFHFTSGGGFHTMITNDYAVTDLCSVPT